ncbi:MAG: dipeptidase [Actinomycetota bacterium]|nr:dipeptidase [Actinomycetota bacterium]
MNDLIKRAESIHADLPVIDGHNDLPWALRIRAGSDLDQADPCGPLAGYHTDVPRLAVGGVGAQFWSVFVPAWDPSPFRTTIEQIDLVHRMTDRCDRLARADTAADVTASRSNGKTASLMGAEGGHSIENSLAALRTLRSLGVRYMTLTHADTIDWADSATDDARHGGLTDFGEQVVREMNRIGMVVDISHVSADTMRHALSVSDRPVMASHSSAFALAPHPRNVPDDVLDLVRANNGVVMANFYPPFVSRAGAEQSIGRFAVARELMARLGDDAAVDAELERMLELDPYPEVTVGDVVDHIEHIADVAGVDHVGIGSDFDGVDATPLGLEDVSTYPAITIELLHRGWNEPEIRGVLGENALRVLAAND